MTVRLLLVAGPPGSARQAVARVVSLAQQRSALVELDTYYESILGGFIAPWTARAREQNRHVISIAADAAGRYASLGYDTTLEGVIEPSLLPSVLNAVAPHVDAVDYAIVRPSTSAAPAATEADLVAERISGRFAWPGIGAQFNDVGRWESHVLDPSHRSIDEAARLLELRRQRGDLEVGPFSR